MKRGSGVVVTGAQSIGREVESGKVSMGESEMAVQEWNIGVECRSELREWSAGVFIRGA